MRTNHTPEGSGAVAGWLPTGAGQAFCWYHPPEGRQRDLAVLLCDPLGSDRMNLHLAYRHLALALARAGIAVLRLDYPGTCDSEGTPREPERLGAIFQGLHAGADFLRQAAGVNRLGLFGARLGGTIAVILADQRDDVELVGLWGAYRSGRNYLRSETALERMSGANPSGRLPRRAREGDVEATGYLYSAGTVEDLRALTLTGLKTPYRARVMVVGWEAGEDDAGLREQLDSAGARVFAPPARDSGAASLESQRVPDDLIGRFVAWLRTHSSEATGAPSSLVPQTLAPEVRLQMGSERVRETVVRFGHRHSLFGILSRPEEAAGGSGNRPAVVLVNGGNNHRVGINRNYVEWARSWAAKGWTVLRFDIRGLGDSPPRTPAQLNRLYLKRTASDVREACDYLEAEHACHHFVVGGLCAGAYQALHMARRDTRVRGLMLLELLRYYPWEPLRPRENTLFNRIKRRWAKVHPAWLVDRGRIGKWLLGFCRRGTHCLVVYREDEFTLQRFLAESSPYLAAMKATGNLTIRELGPSNHILSPLWVQEELEELLTDYLQTLGPG